VIVIRVPQIGLGGGGKGSIAGIGGAIIGDGIRGGGAGGAGLITGTTVGAEGTDNWIPQLEQYTASSLLSAPHSGHFLVNSFPPIILTTE
jgi:hypothetical protein